MATSFHPLLVLLLLTAAQAAQLSVPAATAAPAESLVVPVNFAAQSSLATGIQFDLQYDISTLAFSPTVGNAARLSGKSLYIWELAPGLTRFLLIGLNREPLGDGPLVNLFVNLSSRASEGVYPIKLLNVTAVAPTALAVVVNALDGSISVRGPSGSGSRLQTAGVINASSLLPGPVAPGEIVTVLGAAIGPATPQFPAAGPTSTILDGVSVLFDGIPAPLLYAAPNQINVIAPFGLYKKTSTQLRVTQRGQTVGELQLPVADVAPAIFTLDGSGVGQGAILNQDSSMNSSTAAAAKGSVIVAFVTGGGQTDPPGVDGELTGDNLPKPLLDVSVQIGGREAKVLYAGAAPGMVAGLLQVNCVVPLDAPSGWTVPIVLTVGKINSPNGVTLAVE